MRAETWLAPNVVAIARRIKTLVPGDNLASMVIRSLVVLLVFPLAALACDYPDEGNLPLRRAVTKVKLLPATEAWAAAAHKTGAVVQYALMLDHEWRAGGGCYWTVDARAEGKTWRRFYVSPNGKSILNESGQPIAATQRKATGSAEAKPARR